MRTKARILRQTAADPDGCVRRPSRVRNFAASPPASHGGPHPLPVFPVRSLVVSIVATLLLIAAVAWYLWTSYRGMQAALGEDLTHQRLHGVIVHLDEVLTMSARMAAATGAPRWEERYREYEPELDSAIKELAELASGTAMKDAADRLQSANAKLVELENTAFAFVRDGRREEAAALLAGPEYENQKQAYAETMKRITDALQVRLGIRMDNQRHAFYVGVAFAIAVLPIVLVVWLAVLRSVVRHEADRSRMQEELRRTRQEWEDIFQSIAHPTAIIDANGRILAANRAAADATGRSLEDMRGLSCSEVFHGSDKAAEGCPLKTMFASGRPEYAEVEIQTLGGTFLVSCAPVQNDKGVFDKAIHMAIDIGRCRKT